MDPKKPQDSELQDLGWCIVELMGHRKTGAMVREVVLCGVVMCRCDIPVPVAEGEDQKWMTQFYGGQALYAIHPTTEEIARAVAARYAAPPVSRYELPALTSKPTEPTVESFEEDPENPYDPAGDDDFLDADDAEF